MTDTQQRRPEIETQQQIRRYLATIRNAFLKEGGWQAASSLYLIGGFARGEGTCDLHQGRLRIYNDLDFLVIVPHKSPQRMVRLYQILKRLNNGRFDFRIDFIISTKSELRSPPPLIVHYDIQQNHEWQWGENFFETESVSPLHPKVISKADVLQLLLNRQASMLIGLSLLKQTNPSTTYLQIQLSKPLSAMLAAVQITNGVYTSSVMSQLEWVKDHRDRFKSDPMWKPFQNEQIMRLLEEFETFKRAPQSGHFSPLKENAQVIAENYHLFLRNYMTRFYELSADVSTEALMSHFCSKQPYQWDLLTPDWWVCRLRTGIQARVLKPGPHLHIGAYAAHFVWVAQFLSSQVSEDSGASRWSDWISWYDADSQMNDCDRLIQAWKVSGYGCRVR